MRTINEAYAYIKEQDPKSAVSISWIRSALKTGKLPYVEAVSKYLINLDKLEEILPGKVQEQKAEDDTISINPWNRKRRKPMDKIVLEYEMGQGVERLLYNFLSSCEIDPDTAAVYCECPRIK